ncbi:hypothetical protein J6590_028605 [Homalodisca vitripennis]|nr:hypothetical protein J6590_028605 [Homalodisca vitripennis]
MFILFNYIRLSFNMKGMFLLILIGMEILFCGGGIINFLEKLKQKVIKIKNIMVKIKRADLLGFQPRSEVLYPGLDPMKLNRLSKLWDMYYECQNAMQESTLTMIVPKAVAFLYGTNIMLECEVCDSPKDIFLEHKWYFSEDYNFNNVRLVKETSNIMMKNIDLFIFNIGDRQAGLYLCRKGNHTSRPYIVHVFEKEVVKRVVPAGNTEMDNAADDLPLPNVNVTLTTLWAPWTQCSRCDQVGLKTRQGICTIIANKNIRHAEQLRNKRKTYWSVKTPHEYNQSKSAHLTTSPNQKDTTVLAQHNISSRTTTSSTPKVEPYSATTQLKDGIVLSDQNTDLSRTSTLSTNVLHKSVLENHEHLYESPKTDEINDWFNIIPGDSSTKRDLQILDMFVEGVPCRSKMLSPGFRYLKEIEGRSSEVMVAYCKLLCSTNVMFYAKDASGKIVESANNSAGVFSVLQGLPREVPAISRNVEYAVYNQPFMIICPGTRGEDIPIYWYVNKRAITNKTIATETQGRIQIDDYNRIIFKNVFFEDGRLFTCWQRRKLVGTVRLRVEAETSMKQVHSPATMVGSTVILITFLWIYYKALMTNENMVKYVPFLFKAKNPPSSEAN